MPYLGIPHDAGNVPRDTQSNPMEIEVRDENDDVEWMSDRDLLFALRIESINWYNAHAEAYRQDERGNYVHDAEDETYNLPLFNAINRYNVIQDEILRRMGENI